jgi:hypothetical protein
MTSISFTILVLAASFVTTTFTSFLSPDEEEAGYHYSPFYSPPYWVNPFSVCIDLIRAALRVLQDASDLDINLDELLSRSTSSRTGATAQNPPPGLLRSLVRRFLLGLPVVGAGSLVQMLLSFGLVPVQWLARYRGGRRNRQNNRGTDTATVLLVALLLIGALRCVYVRALFRSI